MISPFSHITLCYFIYHLLDRHTHNIITALINAVIICLFSSQIWLCYTIYFIPQYNHGYLFCGYVVHELHVINYSMIYSVVLQWRYNGPDGVSNYQPRYCLLNRLFRSRSRKTSKGRVTGLCVGNSPVTGEFPVQMGSNAENVSIWWRHHWSDDHLSLPIG